MTLGDFQILIQAQIVGDGRTRTPQELDLATGWALDVLAAKAAEASGPRMLYEFLLDLEAGKSTYRLPKEVRVVKEIFNVPAQEGYSKISYPAQFFTDMDAAYSPAADRSDPQWWQTHRDIHLKPEPSSTERNGLKIAAYARPPIPRDPNVEVAIPMEAERWVIIKAATMLLPPPAAEIIQPLVAQLTIASQDLEGWLWQHHAGIPPAPMEDGVF